MSLLAELSQKLSAAEAETQALFLARQRTSAQIRSVEEEIATLAQKLLDLRKLKEEQDAEQRALAASVKEMRVCVETLGGWKARILPNEEVLLTVHNSGELDAPVETKARYKAFFKGVSFAGFLDPTTGDVFKSPSALCCARLERHGPKKTNQWQGPAHVLVQREGVWIPLNKL